MSRASKLKLVGIENLLCTWKISQVIVFQIHCVNQRYCIKGPLVMDTAFLSLLSGEKAVSMNKKLWFSSVTETNKKPFNSIWVTHIKQRTALTLGILKTPQWPRYWADRTEVLWGEAGPCPHTSGEIPLIVRGWRLVAFLDPQHWAPVSWRNVAQRVQGYRVSLDDHPGGAKLEFRCHL